MPPTYSSHGGLHKVAIVHCPLIIRNRWLHLSQDSDTSWVLRDYIGRRFVRRTDAVDSPVKTHLSAVEQLVDAFEEPPFYAWENIGDWDIYLRMRSILRFGTSYNQQALLPGTTANLLSPAWWQSLE